MWIEIIDNNSDTTRRYDGQHDGQLDDDDDDKDDEQTNMSRYKMSFNL